MPLSQDIIYFQLSQYFHVTFPVHGQSHTEFKRPRFFENTESLTGHVVLMDKKSAENLDLSRICFRNVLLICVDPKPQLAESIASSVIAVDEHASFCGVFNRLMDIFDTFTEWGQALNLSLQDKDGFKKMVDSCILVTRETVCIMDQEFQYVAYSDFAPNQGLIESSDGHDDALPKYILEEYYTLPDVDQIKEKKEVFFQAFTFGDSFLKNLFCDGKYIGRIAVKTCGCNEAELRYYSAVFGQLAEAVEHLYGKYQTFWLQTVTKSELRNLLDHCIRGETISIHEWNKELLNAGWKTTDQLQLVQFSSNLRYDKQPYSKHIISETERLWKACVGFEYDEKTLLLINYDHLQDVQKTTFHQLLAYYVRDNLLIAGISRNFINPNYIRGAYVQTQIAINAGVDAAPTQWCFYFDDYTLDYMLTCSLGKFSQHPLHLCSSKLQKLEEHDRKKGTEYYKTLNTYFECRLNASEAAKRLYIHRSSFLNRLQRIQHLVDIDFCSNDELLYLTLSFRHINLIDD